MRVSMILDNGLGALCMIVDDMHLILIDVIMGLDDCMNVCTYYSFFLFPIFY